MSRRPKKECTSTGLSMMVYYYSLLSQVMSPSKYYSWFSKKETFIYITKIAHMDAMQCPNKRDR